LACNLSLACAVGSNTQFKGTYGRACDGFWRIFALCWGVRNGSFPFFTVMIGQLGKGLRV